MALCRVAGSRVFRISTSYRKVDLSIRYRGSVFCGIGHKDCEMKKKNKTTSTTTLIMERIGDFRNVFKLIMDIIFFCLSPVISHFIHLLLSMWFLLLVSTLQGTFVYNVFKFHAYSVNKRLFLTTAKLVRGFSYTAYKPVYRGDNENQCSISNILSSKLAAGEFTRIWELLERSYAPFTPEEVPATSLKFRKKLPIGRSANFVVFEKCEIVPCMLRPLHVLAKFMLRWWCSHWVYCARRRGPCSVETVPATSSLRPSRLRLVVPTSPSREYNDPAGQHLFHSYSRGQIGNTPDLPLRPASCRQRRRVNKSRHPREVGRNSMKL